MRKRDELITNEGNVRKRKLDKREKKETFTGFGWFYCCTNHSFIPDEGHPLFHSVHTFWDLSEVILADSLLGHAEGAVGAARHAQVSTTAWTIRTEKSFIFDSWIVSRNSLKKKNLDAVC